MENQADLCRQYLRSVWNAEAADTALVYEDEGFSGGTLDRPAFRSMMADAIKHNFRAVVVYRLDRISRNISDFCVLMERLTAMQVGFISIREQFDTTSPMGRAMMYISSVFSQLERETIAERIRDNMHELAKTGRWLGGITPTGYRSEATVRSGPDGRERRACRLAVVEEEAALIRLIFQKFLETRSLTATEQFLLAHQYKTRQSKLFTRFSIRGILSNPVYAGSDQAIYRYLLNHNAALFSAPEVFDGIHGIMAYNRTLQRPGRTNKINPISLWIICVGEHPGLIEGAQWVEAQRLIEQNRSTAYRRPRSHVALLGGLLRCGQCGSQMRPKLTNQQTKAFSYLCTLKERSKNACCQMRNCSGNQLDCAVLDHIACVAENSLVFEKKLRAFFRGNISNYGAQEDSRAIKRRIAEADKEIKALVNALGEAADAGSYIIDKLKQLHAQRQSLQDALKEAQNNPHSPSPEEFLQTASLLASFPALLRALPLTEQRYAVQMLVQGVVWDGRTALLMPQCEDSK